MTDFIVLYKGPHVDMSEIPEDVFKKTMAAWGVWVEKLKTLLLNPIIHTVVFV